MIKGFLIFLTLTLLIPISYADVTEADLENYLGDKGVSSLKKYGEKLGTDSILGQEMSIDMNELVKSAHNQFDPNNGGGACELAAMREAEWSLNEMSREFLKGGIRALIGIFKDVLGIGTGGTGALTSWLQGQAEARANADITKWLGEQPNEIYNNERLSPQSTCGSKYERVIWDKDASTFEIYISGDCKCKEAPYVVNGNLAHVELNDWVVYLSGDVEVELSDSGKEATYKLVNFEQQVYANCGCEAPLEDLEDQVGSLTTTTTIKQPTPPISIWNRIANLVGLGDGPVETENEIPEVEVLDEELPPIYTGSINEDLEPETTDVEPEEIIDIETSDDIPIEIIESDIDDIFGDPVEPEPQPAPEEPEHEPEPEIVEPEIPETPVEDIPEADPEPQPEIEPESSCDMGAFNSCMYSFDIDACYGSCEMVLIDCLPGDHPDAECYGYSEECQYACTDQVEIDCRESSRC